MHPREKAHLYHELGQFLRAGIPLPRAVERLMTIVRGESAMALQAVANVLSSGGTVQEAFSAPPAFAGLDASLFAATDRAGHLEKGMSQAEEYYQAMAGAQGTLLVKVAYPLFILHLAGIVIALPKAITSGMGEFGQALLIYYFCLWGFILGLLAAFRFARRLGQSNAGFDRTLATIPVIGKLRRAFAMSRFCSSYDMQLSAGINVMSALETAAKASGSASVVLAADRALPALRSGETTSTALAKVGGFPEPVLRAMTVGEDTGQLDVELRRLAAEYRNSAFRRLEVIVEWTPKIILILVAAFVAWIYLGLVRSYYGGMMNMIDGK
jgi:type IV pilus assembly protein PilC